MQTVRLSGKINGTDDPNREIRAQMLYTLFAAGWDIQNSNGDEDITLNNIEEKIIAANAFMFMPDPTLQDMFKAVSIFVGYQTLDHHLSDKPTVILDINNSWQPLFALFESLHSLGTISQRYDEFLLNADSAEKALTFLQRATSNGIPSAERIKNVSKNARSFHLEKPVEIKTNVCVFCSASIKDQDYLDEGYALGKLLADSNIGCVSGAGRTGAMGAVVKGCVDANGWAAGSNVPHIIEIEGLPEGLSEFWLRDDIYTRMEVMIEQSNGFIIFPGGAGTVQEVLALLIFKQMGHKLMQNKPIIIYNKPLRTDGQQGFWDKLIQLLAIWNDGKQFLVVDNIQDAVSLARQPI